MFPDCLVIDKKFYKGNKVANLGRYTLANQETTGNFSIFTQDRELFDLAFISFLETDLNGSLTDGYLFKLNEFSNRPTSYSAPQCSFSVIASTNVIKIKDDFGGYLSKVNNVVEFKDRIEDIVERREANLIWDSVEYLISSNRFDEAYVKLYEELIGIKTNTKIGEQFLFLLLEKETKLNINIIVHALAGLEAQKSMISNWNIFLSNIKPILARIENEDLANEIIAEYK